MKGGYRKSLKE